MLNIAAQQAYQIALRDCQAGRFLQAEGWLRQLLQGSPNDAEALHLMGGVANCTGRHEMAVEYFKRAIAINPSVAVFHDNLGVALLDSGRGKEAISAHRRAIELRPGMALTYWHLSVALLVTGEFTEGWRLYERRWESTLASFRQNFPQPMWDGSALNGRTILLHAEQGLGDTLQFIRYVPRVAEKGGRIIVACQPEVAGMVRTIGGIAEVCTLGGAVGRFDVHCPLLSLPRIFGTTVETVPNRVPYLSVESKRQETWAKKLAGGKRWKVGLAWGGGPKHPNDSRRSIPLTMFAKLARNKGITFYSLQKGPQAVQAQRPPGGLELVDFTGELNDFCDTAAFIGNLDLVISVDTAVVHLAGAMGKTVWTLLAFAPDWRWMYELPDSPWYPTMRLFRQPRQGDWESVLERVAEELRAFTTRGAETGQSSGEA